MRLCSCFVAAAMENYSYLAKTFSNAKWYKLFTIFHKTDTSIKYFIYFCFMCSFSHLSNQKPIVLTNGKSQVASGKSATWVAIQNKQLIIKTNSWPSESSADWKVITKLFELIQSQRKIEEATKTSQSNTFLSKCKWHV